MSRESMEGRGHSKIFWYSPSRQANSNPKIVGEWQAAASRRSPDRSDWCTSRRLGDGWQGDCFEGDFVAEGFEFADVASLGAGGIGAAG
jgi:hypothetical protein